jgi:ABC-type branched-subunit amino acid transport system ATPase component
VSEGLVVRDLVVRFGGHTAVNNVSLSAPLGTIAGLIGPNGAGKTTIFNVCSGLLRPSAGAICFRGRDITRSPAQRRAQLGMGRTFQRMELFDSLSVVENVALGREAKLSGSRPLRHVFASREERAIVSDSVARALRLCQIEHLATLAVATLSTGQRRLVELARAIAVGSSLLLLDEPSSGLDHAETAELASILRALVRVAGLGILLVEHDMALVMSICDVIHVLDFGQLLFSGTPEEVRSSVEVRAAYLGTSA